MEVPFLNLGAQYASLKRDLDNACFSVLSSGRYVGGPEVDLFEREFASYCGVSHAVGCASGTAALHLALLAIGVGNGDEVITTANTFAATAEAIVHAGATPVFIDVDDNSRNMSPCLIEEAIGPRTKAIVPVHLHGQSADMNPILAVARKHGIKVVEDAAQAHGATYRGMRTGSWGDLGCFSFYPGKNLGACGEAGIVVTNDGELSRRVRLLANHGSETKNVHVVIGYNYRMATMQAAVLRVKLRCLDTWNSRRRDIAMHYASMLDKCTSISLPRSMPYGEHVFHHYVIRIPNRDNAAQRLRNRGVNTLIHYPIPLHKQTAFARICRVPASLHVTERLSKEILSLPICPEMTEPQTVWTSRCLIELYGR